MHKLRLSVYTVKLWASTDHFIFHFLYKFIMFQVAGLFGDASIGNAINVVVVRLILLEQDEVNITLIKKNKIK